MSTESASGDAYEARILTLVNHQRATHGMSPLRPLSCADHFAEAWAAHMARTQSMFHQSLMPIVSSCRARQAGENIAYGNVSADRMMAMWMASRGHRENILNEGFTHVGIGASRTASGRWYGAQDFTRH